MRSIRSFPLYLLPAFVVSVLSTPAAAQMVAGHDITDLDVPEVRASRIGDAAVTVDGLLDEAVWAEAIPATEFIQTDPREGEPATERTEIRILYDDEAIYIGARLYDRGQVSTRLGRRDSNMSDSDQFTVAFDSYHDHLSAYRFGINPSGVKQDEITATGSWDDDSWDPVWEGAAAIDAEGWVAELRIPFSQLRFSPEEAQTWGIQLTRRINRIRETSVLAYTPKAERGGVARYGHLVGLERIRPGRKVEVVPYVVGRAEYRRVEGDDPFRDGSDYFGSVGVDMKYRLTSNLTLDATFNPDFGQVEVDPAVINLSAYETRFDEKRPFFVEGAGIFRGGASLFYSRRIGRAPQGSLPDGVEFSDKPDAATILGAAKISGRTASGWSIGLLEAVTGRETARYVDGGGELGRELVEPLSNYLVGRVRREFRGGQTVVGATGTAAHRALETEALAERLRSSAYAGGIDLKHDLAGRTWSVEGQFASSYIRGRPAVMIAAQRSSARYYQRPDAGHLRVDSSATSLVGYTARLEIGKRAGLHWRGEASVATTSPGYETNDLGFQSSADRIEVNANINYVENRPGAVFRDWRLNLGTGSSWNFGKDFLGSRLALGGNGQLVSYWGGGFNVSHRFASFEDRLTRGGPLTREPAETRVSMNVSSDSRKLMTLRLSGNYTWGESGGWERSGSLNLGFKPSPNWSLSFGPNIRHSLAAAQFVASIDDSTATATYGRRYVFTGLEQTSASVETRLNVTFTPDLSFELYAQPYISVGDSGEPMALRAPGSFAFDRYEGEVDDLDYNFRSLRGNAVMRWEWRPGSTLFVVWQQRRSATEDVGDFDLARDAGALLRIQPENVFQVKMTYWMGS